MSAFGGRERIPPYYRSEDQTSYKVAGDAILKYGVTFGYRQFFTAAFACSTVSAWQKSAENPGEIFRKIHEVG